MAQRWKFAGAVFVQRERNRVHRWLSCFLPPPPPRFLFSLECISRACAYFRSAALCNSNPPTSGLVIASCMWCSPPPPPLAYLMIFTESFGRNLELIYNPGVWRRACPQIVAQGFGRPFKFWLSYFFNLKNFSMSRLSGLPDCGKSGSFWKKNNNLRTSYKVTSWN